MDIISFFLRGGVCVRGGVVRGGGAVLFNSMGPSRRTVNGRLSGDASGLTSSINVALKMGAEPN